MRRFLGIATVGLLLLSGCASTTTSNQATTLSKATQVREHKKSKNFNVPLREYLVDIAKKNKGFHILTPPDMSVWAIDDYTTVIYLDTGTRKGGVGQPWFGKALREFCEAHGERLMYKVEKEDPISGKKIVKYFPVKPRKILGLRSDEGFNDIAYHDGIKCGNIFEAKTVSGNFHYVGGNVFQSGTLVAVFKTPEPQPLIYFVPNIKSPSGIRYPKTDEFGIAKLSSTKRTYQALYALCKKEHGNFHSYIRDIKEDSCFKPAENIDAFRYMGFDKKEVVLACDNGEKSFIVRYTPSKGTFFKFSDIANSGLEVCNAETYSSRKISKDEGSNNRPNSVPQLIMKAQSQAIPDILALKTASGIDTFKKVGAYTFRGTYNGKDGNCDLVSVIKYTNGFSTTDIINYKICNGQIVEKEPTGVESVPSDVKALIPKVAKLAQLHGRAEMEGNGYRVIANAVRDEKQCAVEVKVLKEIKLVKDEIINACKL